MEIPTQIPWRRNSQQESLLDVATLAGQKQYRQVVTYGIVVFLVGLLLRLALVLPNHRAAVPGGVAEPVEVALSLMTTGRYADAYGAGSGPTAHCAPLYPVLLSFLFRIFGTGARGAVAINVFGSAGAALAFALLPALAVASGLSLSSGVLAGMAGALLPVNFFSQTSGLFEAPLTAVALVALCLLVCRVWATARFTTWEGIVFGIVAGFACLLSPALIQVLVAWSLVSSVRYRPQLRRVLVFLSIAAVSVLTVLAPWAIRNYKELGALIWTRSNFGLELEVSNNDVMTADFEVNAAKVVTMHPLTSESERAKVRSVGEVAYHRSKERQALAWITSHKRRFLLLTAERFRLFWLPNMKRWWQSVFEAALTVMGLCGLALLFGRKDRCAWAVTAVLAAYPAVYYVVQASPRYRFPVEPILFLLAANLFFTILGRRFPVPNSNIIRIVARTGVTPASPRTLPWYRSSGSRLQSIFYFFTNFCTARFTESAT
jgi:hypothetical protein